MAFVPVQYTKPNVQPSSPTLVYSPQYGGKQSVAYIAAPQANRATAIIRKKSTEDASGRCTQVVAASGLGGAVLVGAGGAGAGLLAGGAAGAAIGLVPALFTFGLSIPIGAVIGGTCGTVVGAATGGTVGLTGGSAIGYGVYKKRADLRTLILKAKVKMTGAFHFSKTKTGLYADLMKKKAVAFYNKTHTVLRAKASTAKAKLARTTQLAKAKATKMSTDKDVRAAAKAGAGGAVVLGAGGAAAGAATGGVIGGAIGLVPALFTFGLSIPFFAVIGGGCGLVAGSAMGGTTGAATGVGGYWVYLRREAIRDSIRSTVEKVSKKMPTSTQPFFNRMQQRLGGPTRRVYGVGTPPRSPYGVGTPRVVPVVPVYVRG